MIQTIKLQSAPKVEIEVFSGDPLEYDYFMESFKDVVENLVEDPKQRLVRLLKFTDGDAKELIKHCVHAEPETCYKEAIKLLEKEYGNPLRMSCAYLEKLKNWPPIKNNDVIALKRLHRFLLHCIAFQKKGHIDLDSPLTIRCVQLVLPINMQDGWTGKVSKVRRKKKLEATFADFVDFVEEWCERLSDPVYARGKSKEVKTLKTEIKEVKPKVSCPDCGMQHDMDDCPKFLAKTAREKKDLLFKAKMCFSCYGKDHLASKCENKRKCKTCGNEHPSALHGVSFKILAIQQKRGNATCIVPVRLRHESWGDKEIEVYALLDECSDGTFISETILHEFDDSVKRNTTVEVDTINMKNEIEAVAIRNLIVRGSKELETAYGLEEIKLPETFSQGRIPMDKADILRAGDVEKWDYLKEVARDLPSAKNIPFGLLIGNNCPKALEPLKVIASRNSGPYATRSRLGWYVSAPQEEEVQYSFKCSNIKVTENQVKETSISNVLQEMWREDFIEKASEKKALSKEDRIFLEEMKRSIKTSAGHYVLPLPLRKKVSKGADERPDSRVNKEHFIKNVHNIDDNESAKQVQEAASRGYRISQKMERGCAQEIQIISPQRSLAVAEGVPHGSCYVTMPDNRGQILNRLRYTKKRMQHDRKFKEARRCGGRSQPFLRQRVSGRRGTC